MSAIKINDTVLVRLTDHGREKLEEYLSELLGEMEDRDHAARLIEQALLQHRAKEAVSRFQLWELVHYFGPFTHIGAEPCFVDIVKE